MTMTRTSIESVRSLADVGVEDIALVGNKAATLATLRRAGFQVPGGVVLTTEALAQALTAAGLQDGALQAEVEALPLPTGLTEALAAAVRKLGSAVLAVRSSGVEEDLPDASYAGQYVTVQNVPAEELATAVRHCWASAFSDQVNAYRHAHRIARQVAMAVLIQPMVPADAAGVAFSADPITGDRNTSVVNAIRGLGERLVSGLASPDHWLVRGTQASCRSAPEGAIDARWPSRWPGSRGGSRLIKESPKISSGPLRPAKSCCFKRVQLPRCRSNRLSRYRFRSRCRRVTGSARQVMLQSLGRQ